MRFDSLQDGDCLGVLAQWLEHLSYEQPVLGSNPRHPTKEDQWHRNGLIQARLVLVAGKRWKSVTIILLSSGMPILRGRTADGLD